MLHDLRSDFIFAEIHVSISQEYCMHMARRNGTIAVWSDSGL
jgi:hypothetical protein